MINTARLLKVSVAWMSIVYVICFVVIALFPAIGPAFSKYALHATAPNVGRSVLTVGTFIFGLIIWNVLTVFSVWLFAALYNSIKE